MVNTKQKAKQKRPSRWNEPSTWAGLGLIAQGIAGLVATHGLSPEGWAAIVGGSAAVFAREGQAASSPSA